MAFLVRKLIKMSELFSICERTDIKEIYADIPTTEFRTKNGTLSTWHINSLDDIEDAILAIAFTSSDITKMDFIIIDTDILSKNSLEYKKTYAGQEIAIVDLQDTHYDIVNITIEKLINCTRVYQTVVEADPDAETYIIRYTAGDIRELLKKSWEEKRVDEKKVPEKLKEQFNKLKVN